MRGTKTDLLPEKQFLGEYGFGTGVVLRSDKDLGLPRGKGCRFA